MKLVKTSYKPIYKMVDEIIGLLKKELKDCNVMTDLEFEGGDEPDNVIEQFQAHAQTWTTPVDFVWYDNETNYHCVGEIGGWLEKVEID